MLVLFITTILGRPVVYLHADKDEKSEKSEKSEGTSWILTLPRVVTVAMHFTGAPMITDNLT